MQRRRPCDLASSSPCDRAFYRRLPALYRRGAPRGGGGTAPDPLMYGISNMSAASFLQAGVGGGEAGIASGFGAFVLARPMPSTGTTAGNRVWAESYSPSPAGGWSIFANTTNTTITAAFTDGALLAIAGYTFAPSDYGRVLLICAQYTGGNTARVFVMRGPAAADTAFANYTPAANTTGEMLGNRRGTLDRPAPDVTIFARATFRGAPSTAQIQAFYDATRARGDLPETMDGATITHRASVKDELRGVANPAGRKTYGARLWNGTNVLDAGAGKGLQGQAAGGFCGAMVVRFDSVPGAGNQMLAHALNAGGSAGWWFALSGVALRFLVTNGSIVQSTSYVVTAADVGQTLLFVFQLTAAGALRLFVRRAQVGADVTGAAITIAAGPANPFQIGYFQGSQFFSSGSIFGFSGGLGTPSSAQILQAFDDFDATGRVPTIGGLTGGHAYDLSADIAANNNAMPATIVDRIGADTLTRTGTLEVAIDTATAPPCPAQLTDTITRAPVDALARVGSPVVRTIDPSIDGRRTLGAQGWGVPNYLQSAGGFAGAAAGHWLSWYGRIDAAPPQLGTLLGRRTSAPQQHGVALLANQTSVFFEQVNGVGAIPNAGALYGAIGQPKVVTGVFTGAGNTILLYIDGVFAASQTCVGFTPASTPFRVSGLGDFSFNAANVSWFGDAEGLGIPTAAQVAEHAAATLATGRMQAIAGLTTNLHDATTDILASGVDAVPAQVLDRVGTAHLTRMGGNTVATLRTGVRGLADHDVGQFVLATGGVTGSASGFHLVAVAKIDTQGGASITREILVKSSTSAGYELRTTGQSGTLQFIVYGTSGTLYLASIPITPGMVGTDILIVANSTGSQLSVYAQSVANTASAGVTGFTAAAANTSMGIGGHSNGASFPASGYQVGGMSGGNVALTVPEITQLFTDFAATGRVPRVAGKATHWYDYELDIQEAAGALPVTFKERVSGAENASRIGSGLTLAQRTERVWSYETSPILRGINGIALNNYYVAFGGGWPGDPAGFGFIWVGAIESQAVTSATRMICASRGATANAGWQLASIGANAALQFTIGSTTATATSSTASIPASEVGKIQIVCCWVDQAGKAHIAIRRAEVGAGSASLSSGIYSPLGGALCIGRRADGQPADGTITYGFIGIQGIPALQEYQALHDAILAREQVISMRGREGVLYDFTPEIAAAGNAAPNTFVERVAGGIPLTKQGTPTTALTYARAAA